DDASLCAGIGRRAWATGASNESDGRGTDHEVTCASDCRRITKVRRGRSSHRKLSKQFLPMWVFVGHAAFVRVGSPRKTPPFEEDAMIRARGSAVGGMLVGLAIVASAGCGQRMHSDVTELDNELIACSFSTTRNSYDGPNFWGTITIK